MTTLKAIRVLIIDDSLVFDRFLSRELPRVNERIEIAGYSTNPYDALRKVPVLKPDVITLDVEMPAVNGIDFLKELLPKYPLPVILVSSLNVNVFDALSNGAVDFVKKPDMSKDYTTQIFVQNLCSKIMIAKWAKVKLHSGPKTPAAVRPAPRNSFIPASNETKPCSHDLGNCREGQIPRSLLRCNDSRLLAAEYLTDTRDCSFSLRARNTLIVLGASTGGTEATLQVLEKLPGNTPGIVITQHMPEGFTKMYAERLNKLCRMEVKEAENGDMVQTGRALIAPGGDMQTKVVRSGNGYAVKCYPGDKVNGHRPSVDVLFHSAAEAAKGNAAGIILTGMGQDGAEGLLHMRREGAYTIGQDKESCVVYGMPMMAHKFGAVCIQSSCKDIPLVLLRHLKQL